MATRAPAFREAVKRGAIRSGAMLGAVALMGGAVLLTLALASYHPSDASLNTAAGGPAHNLVGGLGAWVSDGLLSLIGPAAALYIPLIIVAATRLWRGALVTGWGRRALHSLGGIALIDVALSLFKDDAMAGLPGGLGGALGFAGANAVRWGTGFIPDAEVARWVIVALAGLIALAGVIVWALSLGLDADERDCRFF